MPDLPPNWRLVQAGEILPPASGAGAAAAVLSVPTPKPTGRIFPGGVPRTGLARSPPHPHRRRLSRQPGRQPCPRHDPPPAVRTRQNAPLQRSAVEPGAPRHPGPAARCTDPANSEVIEVGWVDLFANGLITPPSRTACSAARYRQRPWRFHHLTEDSAASARSQHRSRSRRRALTIGHGGHLVSPA
jgi:hypothetical protein